MLLGPGHAGAGNAPPPKGAPVPILDDTEWVGPDLDDGTIVTFRFEKGGGLKYCYNGTTFSKGSWKQDGKTLYLEINDKYREMKATITGDSIEGDSWNVKDVKWKTSLYRYRKPD